MGPFKIKKGLGRGLSSLIGDTKVNSNVNKLSVSDLIVFGNHISIFVSTIPIFCNNLVIGINEKARAALGCKPPGMITTSLLFFLRSL